METSLSKRMDSLHQQQLLLADRPDSQAKRTSFSEKELSLMRQSLKRNKIGRSRSFMRKRSYFSKTVLQEDSDDEQSETQTIDVSVKQDDGNLEAVAEVENEEEESIMLASSIEQIAKQAT